MKETPYLLNLSSEFLDELVTTYNLDYNEIMQEVSNVAEILRVINKLFAQMMIDETDYNITELYKVKAISESIIKELSRVFYKQNQFDEKFSISKLSIGKFRHEKSVLRDHILKSEGIIIKSQMNPDDRSSSFNQLILSGSLLELDHKFKRENAIDNIY